MEEILDLLNVTETGVSTKPNEYIVDLDADSWGKVFSSLENQDLLEEESQESQLTDENAHIVYSNDEFNVTLNCQFNEDIYKLIIRKI